jgi:hypothetical protein
MTRGPQIRSRLVVAEFPTQVGTPQQGRHDKDRQQRHAMSA